jgi:hypothetical protein
MANDRVEIVKLGLSAKYLMDAPGAGDERGGITWAPLIHAHREVGLGHALHCCHHIKH